MSGKAIPGSKNFLGGIKIMLFFLFGVLSCCLFVAGVGDVVVVTVFVAVIVLTEVFLDSVKR